MEGMIKVTLSRNTMQISHVPSHNMDIQSQEHSNTEMWMVENSKMHYQSTKRIW